MGIESACCGLRRFAMPAIVASLAIASTACGAHGGPGAPQAPMGHLTVTKTAGPDDAPEEAKTVTVEYAFDRDMMNKDFDKTFNDGFEKKGIKVEQTLNAHAHFDVKGAKITGTVTYVKKGMGHYSIVEADLVASGHYDADVQVDMDVRVKGDSRNAKGSDWDGTLIGGKPVALIKNVMPTNIPIAGPLFLHAHFDLSAACDMEAEGQVHATTGVGISGDVRLSAKYKKAGFESADGKKSKFQFQADTPNFELAPKPYLQVQGKQQHVKGRCSLQPTAVLLLEHSIGAKLSVEPYVAMEAKRGSTHEKWQLDAQGGVSLNAATDVEVFGRAMRKPKEFTLLDVVLSKPGDEMGTPTRTAVAAVDAPATPSSSSSSSSSVSARSKSGRGSRVEVASVLGTGLAKSEPAPVVQKAGIRGLFAKKRKL